MLLIEAFLAREAPSPSRACNAKGRGGPGSELEGWFERDASCALTQPACLLLDQIKREKGVWWMPWQQEAMKDVILCDKLGGAENRL